MDLMIVLAGAGIVFAAVSLSFGIERLVRWLGAFPASDSERSRGLRDLSASIRRHMTNDKQH